MRRNPSCIACGKQFRTTQQLCAHAYTKVQQRGDALHAVVYYLARKRRNRGRVNDIMRWGEKLAGEMLTGIPFLLTPPPEEEWQRTMWELAQRYYYNDVPLEELAREIGVHPNELRRMFGEMSAPQTGA